MKAKAGDGHVALLSSPVLMDTCSPGTAIIASCNIYSWQNRDVRICCCGNPYLRTSRMLTWSHKVGWRVCWCHNDGKLNMKFVVC